LGSTGLELRGFVQGSWQGNYTSLQNEFRVDEVQLELSREWRNKMSFMLRLNYRHVDSFDATGATLGLDYNKFIEQAWVSVDLLKHMGLSFQLGKFRIPVGIESPNINEMFTYTRSYTLEAGAPQFGTGLMIHFRKSVLDLAVFAINGWNTLTDNNDAKTFGGRLGFSLLDGDLTFGVSYIAGAEPIPNRNYSNVRSPRHTIDFDLMYTGVKRLTLGFEFNYGHEDRASQVNIDKRARWLSTIGLVHYKFLPWLAGTLRYEHADDPDGSRLYQTTPQVIGSPTAADWFSQQLTIESLTLSLLFTIADGAYGVLEWRNDYLHRDQDRVFPSEAGNPPARTRRLVAASLYYTW
jgi:hypothetical protein